MGLRCVVMLSMDSSSQWQKDPELGEKIYYAYHHVNSKDKWGAQSADIGYGRVVECTHADTKTLAFLQFYDWFTPVAHGFYTQEDVAVLKDAADKMGYRLVKKSVKAEA
jgi:hypothetical protein